MKTPAIALAILISLSGCAAQSTPTENFSSVVKEEVSNFLLGKDLLRCNVGYAIGGQGCDREIELMVFSSQRIVKKFKEMTPNEEVSQLVQDTITSLESVANSGYETACAAENNINGEVSKPCQQSRLKIAGDKQFVLQDVWDSLDAWQAYF